MTCPRIAAVAAAQALPDQPATLFAALETALGTAPGHRLFTILAFDAAGEAERRHSSRPDAYPIGGRKPVPPGAWRAAVLERGEPFLGATPDALRAVYADHALIATLGCGSTLNLPVRWRGHTLGALNLLHREGWYDAAAAEASLPFAQLALPGLLDAREGRGS
jgi:hypothetical protein